MIVREIDKLEVITITPDELEQIIKDNDAELFGDDYLMIDIDTLALIIDCDLEAYYGSSYNEIKNSGMVPIDIIENEEGNDEYVFYAPSALKDTAHKIKKDAYTTRLFSNFGIEDIYYYDEDFESEDIVAKKRMKIRRNVGLYIKMKGEKMPTYYAGNSNIQGGREKVDIAITGHSNIVIEVAPIKYHKNKKFELTVQ